MFGEGLCVYNVYIFWLENQVQQPLSYKWDIYIKPTTIKTQQSLLEKRYKEYKSQRVGNSTIKCCLLDMTCFFCIHQFIVAMVTHTKPVHNQATQKSLHKQMISKLHSLLELLRADSYWVRENHSLLRIWSCQGSYTSVDGTTHIYMCVHAQAQEVRKSNGFLNVEHIYISIFM